MIQVLTQSAYSHPPLSLSFSLGTPWNFLTFSWLVIKQSIFFKSEMAANLCPPQPRMNVEILLSACNSPNKLGPAGKIIVGFKIA